MKPFFDWIAPDELPGDQLDALLAMGWYRMHQTLFTLSHLEYEVSRQVHWLRMPVGAVTGSRAHRRIRKLNAGFHVRIDRLVSIPSAHAELYARYRASIDFDGADTIRWSMYGPEVGDRNIFQTHVISVHDGDRLVAGGYFDVGDRSAASILHFYDPEYARYSPGKFLMLITVDFLKENGFEFYYPGYLVAGWPKMNYKLFLGKDITEYYDPGTMSWLPFDERILEADIEPDASDGDGAAPDTA